MVKNTQIDYDFTNFLNADYSVHSDSSIWHLLKDFEDVYNSYGGFPDSLTEQNTQIHQLWWSPDDIDYELLGNLLGLEVASVSSIKQDPGNLIPLHCDMFFQIKKRYPDRAKEKIVRANIFLEDAKLGHLIQYIDENQKVQTCLDWKAGQGIMWDSDVLHIGANIGLEPKYTLQVSGFLK